MRKNLFFLVFITVCISLSCEKEVSLDFDHTVRLCLNSILNPDSTMTASLTFSKSLDNSGNIKAAINGNITLYENDSVLGQFEEKGNGKYVLGRKPREGETYMIIAEVEGFHPVSAETTVPRRPEIEYSREITGYAGTDSAMAIFNLNVKLKDKPGTDNYWIYEKWVINGIRYGGSAREINAPFLDDFNKVTDSDSKYGYTLSFGVRLSDEGYDGKILEFVIPDFYEETDRRYTESVGFINADKHYDKYLKTSVINRMKETSELPFFEPVQIHSNINGGYGIFGSCAVTEIKP